MNKQRAEQEHTMASRAFQRLEHVAHILLGVLLAGVAALALIDAAIALWHGAMDLGGKDQILGIIDQLLFVFMLIEILHTVRASLLSGGLSCEPFLVVGLIASIRRVLVITLQTSDLSRDHGMTPDVASMMRASMIELVVMGGLILAMVISIYLLHRARPGDDEPAGSSP